LYKNGPLDDEEWGIIRQHPEYAHKLLYPVMFLRPAIDIPYCHHERWDGSGYPRGLQDTEIPFPARIFAVADVFDAMLSPRLYRPAWSESQTIEYIRSESGRHFDPQVVEAFLQIMAKNTSRSG
jgi:HD-GYP domain-containing protein (c-di-GMP phosphodiesterase class II)